MTYSVFHCQSLPYLSNICKQGWSLPDLSSLLGSAPRVGIWSCESVTNTLAYYGLQLLIAIKGFTFTGFYFDSLLYIVPATAAVETGKFK
jgi:hypothetical protein